MSINSVCISGNLTADVTIRSTNTGTNVYSFGVAVNDRRRNQQGEWEEVPNFVDCTMFDKDGKRAWIANCLRKGFKVTVHGRLQQDKWQDKDGNNRTALKVIVADIDAQWPPRDGGGYQQRPQQQQVTQAQQGYFQGVQPVPAQQPVQQYQQPVQQPQQEMWDSEVPF